MNTVPGGAESIIIRAFVIILSYDNEERCEKTGVIYNYILLCSVYILSTRFTVQRTS